MDEQQRQSIIDPAKVIAGAIASPAAALLTSRFGVGGTMIGLALSAVIITVISDVLKVYLARAPGTVTSIPGGFSKSRWRRILARLRLPFSKFSSLPPARRRPILIGSVIAGGIAFLAGLIIVTGLELGVGKSLSCWVWSECPEGSATSDGKGFSTRPSILGGGQSASSSPQVEPFNSQQQPTPGVPESPSQTPGISNSGEEIPSPSPGQRWSPSGNPSDTSEEQQQRPSDTSEEQQQRPSDTSEEQQQENQQRSSPEDSKNQQRGDQASVPSVRDRG